MAIVLLIGLAILALPAPSEQDGGTDSLGLVVRVRLEDEAITPVIADYLERAYEEALEIGAHAVVIELDTPGGLMSSTQKIVRDILSSPIPIFVYVAPRGARAASAGVFITLSAHVAAMAPGTHIGAAHPVSIGGMPGGGAPQQPADTAGTGVMEQKVLNDAVAWARSLAELRGRNADWAERAVSESQSVTATDAFTLGVIDLVAEDVAGLLRAVDGDTVEANGVATVLRTRDAEVVDLDMRWRERVLGVISSPNIAFLLLMLGFYGLLFEFYTPGWGVPGTVGAVCLILGFFGLAMLPVNYAGLALLVVGLGMLVAEAFVTSFGMLTVGGVVCVALGGLMLIDSPTGILRVSAAVVIPFAIATGLIAAFLVGTAVRASRHRVVTGSDAIDGAVVQATGDFRDVESAYRGSVRMHGEIWQAVAGEPVEAGERLVVYRREGLTLFVKKVDAERRADIG